MSEIERCHWHRPDPEPPERVIFWRGGIRRDLPRWEQEYVRADQLEGAVEEAERLREIVARASRLAESERAGMVLQVLREVERAQ
jgi:hypothetical protein